MRIILTLWLAGLCLAAQAFDAATDYKSVRVEPHGNVVRVRLPLTDVTGKVRVKFLTTNGLSRSVAPSQSPLGPGYYLEWQIGYDSPTTNSPSSVPEIHFKRQGQTKFGHELAKIILESIRTGVLSTNDLTWELAVLKTIPATAFEENQPMEVETFTNRGIAGFQRSVQHIPQFTKTTPDGSVQIQLKQKQRAVGLQAMVYVCLPLEKVLDTNGAARSTSPAKPKETVFYEFNRQNAALIIDIIQAFGMASQQHNEDIQNILGKILETAAKS